MLKKLMMHMAIGIYFIAYLLALYHHNIFWGDILSPIGALIAAGTLFWVYSKSTIIRFSWFSLGMACVCYALADLSWAGAEIMLGIEPNGIRAIHYLYAIATVSILLSGIAYMGRVIKNLNKMQLLLDIVALSVGGLIIFWVMVMDSDFSIWLGYMTKGDKIASFVLMCIDFTIIVGVAFWALSIRISRIPYGPSLTVFSCGLYAITELILCNNFIHSQYSPNSLVEAGYIGAFLAIGCGGVLALKQEARSWANDFYNQTNNIGPGRRGWLLLAFPVILYLYKGWANTDFVILISVLIVYQSLSNYVQNAARNEQQLQYEQNINAMLESKIMERTMELERTNRTLEYISKHDFVTKIYNGWHFKQAFEQIIETGGENLECILIYIDVDRFKDINDTYGHDVGDKILVRLSRRFLKWNQCDALLARLGGDEFVFVIPGRYTRAEIEKVVRSLIQCCNRTMVIDEQQFNIAVSIGIAIYPKDGQTRNCMMKNADIAMYNAKQKGSNQYSFFTKEMTEKLMKKQEIEMLLKNADFDSEFELYYQPQFDVQRNELVGAEALIRWHSPEKGNIMPGDFIEIAEEIGIIKHIGEWVLHEAAHQVGEWNNKYSLDLQVGINISPKQLDSMNFISIIENLINIYKLRPEWLDIEITESIAMRGEKTVTDIFNALADLRVSASIDDFGTGYSSLSYIQRFSFDRLKIAKPLIDRVASDLSTEQIVKAIIMMGKGLSVRTIAEGVETQEQLDLLKRLGCDEIQGYIFSRPIPAEDFENKYLKKSNVVAFDRIQIKASEAKWGYANF